MLTYNSGELSSSDYAKTVLATIDAVENSKDDMGAIIKWTGNTSNGKTHWVEILCAAYVGEKYDEKLATPDFTGVKLLNLESYKPDTEFACFVTDVKANVAPTSKEIQSKVPEGLKSAVLTVKNKRDSLFDLLLEETSLGGELTLRVKQDILDFVSAKYGEPELSSFVELVDHLSSSKNKRQAFERKFPEAQEGLDEEESSNYLDYIVSRIHSYLKTLIDVELRSEGFLDGNKLSDEGKDRVPYVLEKLRQTSNFFTQAERHLFPLALIQSHRVKFVSMTVHKMMFPMKSAYRDVKAPLFLFNKNALLVADEADALTKTLRSIILGEETLYNKLSLAKKVARISLDDAGHLTKHADTITNSIESIIKTVESFENDTKFSLSHNIYTSHSNEGNIGGSIINTPISSPLYAYSGEENKDAELIFVERDGSYQVEVVDKADVVGDCIKATKISERIDYMLGEVMSTCSRAVDAIYEDEMGRGSAKGCSYGDIEEEFLHRIGCCEVDADFINYFEQYRAKLQISNTLKVRNPLTPNFQMSTFNGGSSCTRIDTIGVSGVSMKTGILDTSPEKVWASVVCQGATLALVSATINHESCMTNLYMNAVVSFCGGETVEHNGVERPLLLEPQSEKEHNENYCNDRPFFDTALKGVEIKTAPTLSLKQGGDEDDRDVIPFKGALNDFANMPDAKLGLFIQGFRVGQGRGKAEKILQHVEHITQSVKENGENIVLLADCNAKNFFNRNYGEFVGGVLSPSGNLFELSTNQQSTVESFTNIVDQLRSDGSLTFASLQKRLKVNGINLQLCKQADSTEKFTSYRLNVPRKGYWLNEFQVCDYANSDKYSSSALARDANLLAEDNTLVIKTESEWINSYRTSYLNAKGGKSSLTLLESEFRKLLRGDLGELHKLGVYINGRKVSSSRDIRGVSWNEGAPLRLGIVTCYQTAEKGVNLYREVSEKEIEDGKVIKLGDRKDGKVENLVNSDFLYLGNPSHIISSALIGDPKKTLNTIDVLTLTDILSRMRQLGEITRSTEEKLVRVVLTGNKGHITRELVSHLRNTRSYRENVYMKTTQTVGRLVRRMLNPAQQKIVVHNNYEKMLRDLDTSDKYPTPLAKKLFNTYAGIKEDLLLDLSKENKAKQRAALQRDRETFFRGEACLFNSDLPLDEKQKMVTVDLHVRRFLVAEWAGFESVEAFQASAFNYIEKNDLFDVADTIYSDLNNLYFVSDSFVPSTYFIRGNSDSMGLKIVKNGVSEHQRQGLGGIQQVNFTCEDVERYNYLLACAGEESISTPKERVKVFLSPIGFTRVKGYLGEAIAKKWLQTVFPDGEFSDMELIDYEKQDGVFTLGENKVFVDFKNSTLQSLSRSERFEMDKLGAHCNNKVAMMQGDNSRGVQDVLFINLFGGSSLHVKEVEIRAAAGHKDVASSKLVERYKNNEVDKKDSKKQDKRFIFLLQGIAPEFVSEGSNYVFGEGHYAERIKDLFRKLTDAKAWASKELNQ
ncbi:hypothetical protein [Vibrio crassostreae]|uniref:hypothetical protein n=1 Tax=Vibrio crassostreae TaxID=246167 RepID=UPI001B310778|nr:hypothetical protein [Vibrio crassostreae]